MHKTFELPKDIWEMVKFTLFQRKITFPDGSKVVYDSRDRDLQARLIEYYYYLHDIVTEARVYNEETPSWYGYNPRRLIFPNYEEGTKSNPIDLT